MRLLSKMGLDKTRGQIFVGFIVMMIIVLSLTVSSLYYLLSKVQKENASRYIDEIAEQASGRLESLLSEINVLTLQLAMDERVQDQLADELRGETTTYDEKMQLRKILIDKTAYSETIREIELFSEENSLYPIVEQNIAARVGERYVREANEAHQVGAMIWIGRDPRIRRICWRSGGSRWRSWTTRTGDIWSFASSPPLLTSSAGMSQKRGEASCG